MSNPNTELNPNVSNSSLELQSRIFSEKDNKRTETLRSVYSLLHFGRLDWYILFRFLFILLGILFLLSLVYIIMDFLNCSDVFMQKCSENKVPLWKALVGFYGPRLIVFYDQLLYVLIILSGVITFLLMIQNQEVVALACMGIRRVRAAYPIFIASIIIITLATINREIILPTQRAIVGGDINSYFNRSRGSVEKKTDPLTSVTISGESLDLEKNAIIKPIFSMPVKTLDKYGQEIKADIAYWEKEILGDDATVVHPAGFLLKNVVADKNRNLDNQPTLTIQGVQTLITPLTNSSWLHKGDCFLTSGIEIIDLTLNLEQKEFFSIRELQRVMERMSINQRTDAAIMLHKRLIRPFIDFCIIFVGLSFILTQENRALIIGSKVLVWILFCMIVTTTCSLLAGSDQLISPALAGWLPLIIFSAMAAYVWDDVFC